MNAVKKVMIELFCGRATISKEFKKRGWTTFSIDIRKRKGVCEPDLKKDIMKLRVSRDIPYKSVFVVWASPPCDVFSNAGAWAHWDGDNPKTQKCLEHIEILKKTLRVIELLQPGYFFIENPKAKMRYHKPMIDFLIKNNAMIKELTYSTFGFDTLKPTNIFTNALDLQFPEIDVANQYTNFCSPGTLDNLTKTQKQAIPQKLAEYIVDYCENKINELLNT